MDGESRSSSILTAPAEKALAILGCHPYLIGHLHMAISPWADMRIHLPQTNVAPRVVRPAKTDGVRTMPCEGEIWDSARPWGSIKSVSMIFEMAGPTEHSGPAHNTMHWKATIDFWYEDEAAAFELATNATGLLLGWQV